MGESFFYYFRYFSPVFVFVFAEGMERIWNRVWIGFGRGIEILYKRVGSKSKPGCNRFGNRQ